MCSAEVRHEVDLQDRIAGALLGLHAGDCLGATREFEGPDPTRSHRDVTGGGPFGWEPGEPTDDTALTAVVLRAYERGFSLESVADGMLSWYREGPKDVGAATAAALERYAATHDPRTSGSGPGQRGNGSLMRCLPTALARTDTALRVSESRLISAITHNDPICVEACVAYNEIVCALLAGTTVDAALGISLATSRNTDVADSIELGRWLDLSSIATKGEASVPYGNRGHVLDCLSLAVAALVDARSFEEILIDIVSLGGDADTTGAVAGGLVGARDGVGAIPARWLAPLWLRTECHHAATWLVSLRQQE